MAANPFEQAYFGHNPFDIYNDVTALASAQSPRLPGGGCNFVDLNTGTLGSRCGCRRFWIRRSVGSPVQDQAGWCMCNHHACYHDEGTNQPQAVEHVTIDQENELPHSLREPLSPVMDTTAVETLQNTTRALDSIFPQPGTGLSFLREIPREFDHHAHIHNIDSSLPDTMSWGAFPQEQQDANHALPPIPSQCLLPSQTASTSSSVQARYNRPFAGKGLQTLRNSKPATRSSLRLEPLTANGRSGPSEHTVTGGSLIPAAPQMRGTTVGSLALGDQAGDVSHENFKNLTDQLGAHEQRLDRLETVSFSIAGHEDCHDKNEHMDLRMTDLESRVEEVEKLFGDEHEAGARRNPKYDETASHSAFSLASGSTARPTHSQELHSQLQSLQAQVNHLQTYIPSNDHSWQLEVVVLPFPLRKIWQDLDQFKTEPAMDGDDWTQLPMTCSSRTLRSHSPFHADWAASGRDVDWLLPRAFSERSIIDKRLRSRGFIKTIRIHGPDARSVHNAITMSFESILKRLQVAAPSRSANAKTNQFLGLQAPWVPLRKVHKDSRLRYLTPAEMLSPATWDVNFIHSVAMKAAEPKLFVTHPEAYLQDMPAYKHAWTWQMIKEGLPIYVDNLDKSAARVGEVDDCWAWNELLDESPNALTSNVVRQDHSGLSRPSLSSAYVRGQSPALSKGRRGVRPPHIRTASMPIGSAMNFSPSTSRRRIVSSGRSRLSSPFVRPASQAGVAKSRRTRSPSHTRFTPRWTASPSPVPLDLSERFIARGTTPVAYATPYSNAPLQEVRVERSGSVGSRGTRERGSNGAYGIDELYNIEIYESSSDEMRDEDFTNDSEEDPDMALEMTGATSRLTGDSQQAAQLPEDEAWPGIEDRDHMSDGENIDPDHVDQRSDVSSQPSEYPSTQLAWPKDGSRFQIHEDANEDGEEGNEERK